MFQTECLNLYLQDLVLIIRNLDHSVLPFDLAQGGEPVEPFRVSNFVLRIYATTAIGIANYL